MNKYIWQTSGWGQFSWDEKALLPLLSNVRLKQGKLIQKINSLIPDQLKKAESIIFEEETLKTAQIEGEKYNPESVKSSINKRLGLDYVGLLRTERHIDGLVEVLFDATLEYKKPLTKQRLSGWHAALFPTGYSGLQKIKVGKFRMDDEGPMQVVSGSIGKEKVHFQAPPATEISEEMNIFLDWWKKSESELDGIIRAGIAHLYFITIHPFDDGNGRITRALTDMAFAQDDNLSKRYYSLSNAIVDQKKKYYEVLEQSQKDDKNITDWLVWFIKCFSQALDNSSVLLENIFSKAEFWIKHSEKEINVRQIKVLNKLLDVGKDKFEGGLTTRKYISFTKISRMTAIREIQDLLAKGMLVKNKGEGRNVSYDVSW